MGIKKYQVFEEEKFLGIRTSLENEEEEDTRQRLIKDFGYSENIAIFYLKHDTD